MINNIPYLGSGLGYRPQLHKNIYEHAQEIDFLEIITESFFDKLMVNNQLERLAECFPIVPHGVSLSIGSLEFDRELLVKIKEICKIIKAPYYSEHLCISKVPGLSVGHLTPIWYSKENLKKVIVAVNKIQEYLEIPIVLENITTYFTIPNADHTLGEFINKLVEQTGCGILLDLENLSINSMNQNYDPFEFIDILPLSHIIQVHLAGGTKMGNNYLIDSHNKPVSEKTWSLLEYLSQKIDVKAVLLEHDNDFPEDFSHLLRQIKRAKNICHPK